MKRFGAFLSYAHADQRLAQKLANALESYRTPRALVRRGVPRRIDPIFRDRDELRSGDALHSSLRDALACCGSLIVLCSPRAKERPWIQEEIAIFKEGVPARPILPVLIEGEPEASFPPGIEAGSTQPIAADLRDPRRFSEERLRLLAPLLGVGFDDLRRRDHQRAIRRLVALSGFLTFIVVAIAGMGLYAWRQRRLAETRLGAALDAANAIVFDIDQQLEPLAASSRTRVTILEEAGALLTKLEGTREQRDQRLLYVRAVVDSAKGDLARVEQEPERAASLYTTARATALDLMRRAPSEPRYDLLFELASADLADMLTERDEDARALDALDQAQRVALDLEKKHADTVDARRAAARVFEARGDLHRNRQQWSDAKDAYSNALERAQLVANAKHRPELELDVGTLEDKLGQVAEATSELEDARQHYAATVQVLRRVRATGLDSAELSRELAMTLARLGRAELATGASERAESSLSEQLRLRRALVDQDPSNRELQSDLAEGLMSWGKFEIVRGHVEQGNGTLTEACEKWDALYRDARTDFQLQNLLACLDLLADQQLYAAHLAKADEIWKRSESLFDDARSRSTFALDERTLSVILEKRSEVERRRLRFEEARQSLERSLELRRSAVLRAPEDVLTKVELIATLERFAELHRAQSDFDSAQRFALEAVSQAKRLHDSFPQDTRVSFAFVVAEDKQARVLHDIGHDSDARSHAELALAALGPDGNAIATFAVWTTMLETSRTPDAYDVATRELKQMLASDDFRESTRDSAEDTRIALESLLRMARAWRRKSPMNAAVAFSVAKALLTAPEGVALLLEDRELAQLVARALS